MFEIAVEGKLPDLRRRRRKRRFDRGHHGLASPRPRGRPATTQRDGEDGGEQTEKHRSNRNRH